mgnify:CR=1 FL=1
MPSLPPPTRLRVRSVPVDVTGDLLARVPDEIDPREVVAWLRNPQSQVRSNAALILGNMEAVPAPALDQTMADVLWRATGDEDPDIRLLAPFVDFLLARRPDFRWTPGPGIVRHADWQPIAAARIEDLVERLRKDPRHNGFEIRDPIADAERVAPAVPVRPGT